MLKVVRIVAVGALLFGALVPGSAEASSPSSGTIDRKHQSASWTGGPFLAARPIGCLGPGDSTCDYYFLTLRLPEGARIQINLTTAKSTTGLAPVDGDDYDIYVWSPDDEILASGATDSGNETLEFTHKPRQYGSVYEVEVVPFLVRPGSRYSATAKVTNLG